MRIFQVCLDRGGGACATSSTTVSLFRCSSRTNSWNGGPREMKHVDESLWRLAQVNEQPYGAGGWDEYDLPGHVIANRIPP